MKVIFDVFHVSQLKKCLHVPKGAIESTSVKIQSDLTYEERPIRVLETMERVTRSKVIKLYKVTWNNHSEQDATWKREDYLREVSLLGTRPVVTPILGCNMAILVAI